MLFVAGSHLLTNYGRTIEEIEKDGFKVDYQIHSEFEGRIPVTMAKSAGVTLAEFATAFHNFRPDIVVIHGDRFEALSAAVAASMLNIFVAHIQGGEVTGTIDEHFRHAITKLSHIHFPSTEKAKERIIKLGEPAEAVHAVGCPASDLLIRMPRLNFNQLTKKIFPLVKKEGWKKSFNRDYILVLYHPVTTEFPVAEKNIQEILEALRGFKNSLVVLWPNIDAGGEKVVLALKHFEREEDGRVGIFPHFDIETYINLMRHAQVMVGNSSSGIREACYFGTPVVDIGTRQDGRERSHNVITVGYNRREIAQAIKRQIKHGPYQPVYLYGNGRAGERIAEILARVDVGKIQKQIAY